jgi:hypothetical protein
MRRILTLSTILLLGTLMMLAGCRSSTDCWTCDPLPAPSGVFTVTGDRYVEVFWDEIQNSDVDGYRIYRSVAADGPYVALGSSSDGYYLDDEVSNGVTYYYAVSAYDHNDDESDLSYELVHDTPRPDGTNLVVYDEDALAGVDFSGWDDVMVLPWDDPYADMYLFWDADSEHYAMASTDVILGEEIYGTDLQPAGYVDSLDELDWAPEGGWSTEQADIVILRVGHAYWVWTWDGNFAKFQVQMVGEDFVILDWAYQTDEGNPELVVIAGDGPPRYRGKSPRADTEESPAQHRASRSAADRNRDQEVPR